MNRDIEFHYVISCRNGKWTHALDVEESMMEDGTFYDYDTHEWVHYDTELEDTDNDYYKILQSALRQMNGEDK